MLTTRYSAVFLNGEFMGEPKSGNPGESKIKYFVLRMVAEINCSVENSSVPVTVGNTQTF